MPLLNRIAVFSGISHEHDNTCSSSFISYITWSVQYSCSTDYFEKKKHFKIKL